MLRPLTKFTPTHPQLVAAIDDVAYEVEQLIGICHHLTNHGPVPVGAAPETQRAIVDANVYLEAFLLHVRVLSDFFEARARSKRNGADSTMCW